MVNTAEKLDIKPKRFDFWLAAAYTMYFAWGIGWICYLSYRAIKGIP